MRMATIMDSEGNPVKTPLLSWDELRGYEAVAACEIPFIAFEDEDGTVDLYLIDPEDSDNWFFRSRDLRDKDALKAALMQLAADPKAYMSWDNTIDDSPYFHYKHILDDTGVYIDLMSPSARESLGLSADVIKPGHDRPLHKVLISGDGGSSWTQQWLSDADMLDHYKSGLLVTQPALSDACDAQIYPLPGFLAKTGTKFVRETPLKTELFQFVGVDISPTRDEQFIYLTLCGSNPRPLSVDLYWFGYGPDNWLERIKIYPLFEPEICEKE